MNQEPNLPEVTLKANWEKEDTAVSAASFIIDALHQTGNSQNISISEVKGTGLS